MSRDSNYPDDMTHDLLLPTLLFAAVGGMTWAVRGCVGFGASSGCIFAGVTLGTVWWFIARDPCGVQSRRYASGWIILAMTVAFGVAGCRGWMQWPQFFNNALYTDFRAGEFVPIPRAYGFLWLFLAGIPWAGLGACGLAWCASGSRTTPLHWIVRLACGIGLAYILSVVLYPRYPEVFLPLYDTLKDKYQDLENNPSLWKLVRDNREAMIQMGLYLGFLGFEIARRDWKNTLLITTVGLINGLGWALLQNWMWAYKMWPGVNFNWWRAWETSGGISIGVAYGAAYYLVNRRMRNLGPGAQESSVGQTVPSPGWLVAFLLSTLLIGVISLEVMPVWCSAGMTLVALIFGIVYFARARRSVDHPDAASWAPWGPNLERWGAYTGLIVGLGLSVRNGLGGRLSIYRGNLEYWDDVFMLVIGPLMMLALIAISVRTLSRPRPAQFRGDPFPHAYAIVWCVLTIQYALAILISAPLTEWSETVFAIYYALLFFITALIVFHYHFLRRDWGEGVRNQSGIVGQA